MLTPPPKRPLFRSPNPEQLDQMLKIMPSRQWLALLVLAATLLAAAVWSVVSQVPLRASAQGILLTPQGVADVVAPADGRLTSIRARPGQQVKAGDVVAELDQPANVQQLASRRLELDKLRDQLARIQAFQRTEEDNRARRLAESRTNLQRRIASLAELEAGAAEALASAEQLLARGVVVRDRVLQARTQLQQIQADRMQAASSLTQMETETIDARSRSGRELLDLEQRMSSAQRDIEVLQSEGRRTTAVTAPADGLVVELAANPGEIVGRGTPVMRMLPGSLQAAGQQSQLVADLYIASQDGKKVRPGMAVQVIPSTVRIQRDGYIFGKVLSVSEIPASREGMMRTLKNSALVEQLLRNGPPLQATVQLQAADTPSGFAWSSGKGPDVSVSSGTMAEGRIVVGQMRVIALVLPRAEELLAAVGIR